MRQYRPHIRISHCRFLAESSGQSLVETTVFLVLAIIMLGFAVNITTYLMAVFTINSAAGNGAIYASQGVQSVSAASLPAASVVSQAVLNEMGNLTGSAAPTISVCSAAVGSSSGISQCTNGSTPSFIDPESVQTQDAGQFQTNAVQVTYTIKPLIPMSIFGQALMPASMPETYTKTIYMRSIN